MAHIRGPQASDPLVGSSQFSFESFALTDLSTHSQPSAPNSTHSSTTSLTGSISSRDHSPRSSTSTARPQVTAAPLPLPPLAQGKASLRWRMRQFYPLRWAWEIGALLVSVICTALILTILFMMDGQPMRRWTLPIQPNSLVAVFSTIAKSALLVPLSECIGQLKWTFFDTPKMKPLDRLHAFDKASRGPWGSFTFLCTFLFRKSAVLASIGALLTLLSLGFEPFTQQVLQIHAQHAPLANLTGTVSTSTSFLDAQVIDFLNAPDIEYPLSTGMVDFVALKPADLLTNVQCPTLYCQLAEFTSLGLCETCTSENVTFGDGPWQDEPWEHDFQGCENSAISNSSANTPDRKFYANYTAFKEYVTRQNPYSWERMCTIKKRDFPTIQVWISSSREGNETYPSIDVVNPDTATAGSYEVGIAYMERSKKTGLYNRFSVMDGGASGAATESAPEEHFRVEYCVGINEVYDYTTISPIKLELPNVSIFTCFRSSSNPIMMDEIDHLGFVNGTVTHCQLNYCAKRYTNVSIQNSIVTYGKVEEWPLKSTGSAPIRTAGGFDFPFRAEGLEETFYAGNITRNFLAESISRTLQSTTLSAFLIANSDNKTWTSFFHGLADVVSKVIQGPGNPAAVNITSTAFGQDIYVRVRWPWLVLPLALIIFSALLLLLTALESRNRPYLFKNSVLATLLHGLEEWDDADTQPPRKVQQESEYELEKIAAPMRVRLRVNDGGVLKLKRD